MVTDSTPMMMWNTGEQQSATVVTARDQRMTQQAEQIAQYWQRCDRSPPRKLSESHSASDTLVSEEDDDEEEEEDDEDEYDDEEYAFEEDDGSDCDARYVHYSQRSSRGAPFVSGLPLLCGNCGVSFFSLRSVEHEDDCYCSGECKWSVIMYQEMDRRMHSMRSCRARAANAMR